MDIDKVIQHLRDRDYMSGVELDKSRVRATGEIFTLTALVQKVLENFPDTKFSDPTMAFPDSCWSDGQFFSEVIIKEMEHGSTYEQAFTKTYFSMFLI